MKMVSSRFFFLRIVLRIVISIFFFSIEIVYLNILIVSDGDSKSIKSDNMDDFRRTYLFSLLYLPFFDL